MHDLYIEQGIKHLSELLGHVRQQSTTGAMMRAQLQWCQLQAGCGFHLLKTPHILIDYIEDCWIMCIRDFLRKFQLRVEFNSLLQQELLCDKDEFIMDALRERGDCTYVELQRLNACRMWHKVSRLSEISTLDGKQLLLGPLTGGKIEQYSSSLKWPRQGCPMRKDWNLWRRKLQLVFSINGKSCTLRQNLGKWRPGCLCLQEWKTVAY